MNAPEQEPTAKFVVDEDWKARAQAEKEALQKAREESGKTRPAGGDSASPSASPPHAEPAAVSPKGQDAVGQEKDEPIIDFPPASFSLLFAELGSQAVLALEAASKSQGNKRTNLLGAARHAIDTLDLFEEKCKGNLTSEEQSLLARYLQVARMAYLQSARTKG